MEEKVRNCNYSIESRDGNREIIFDCKHCEGSFSFEECLSYIIKALQNEYNIDSLVFKDFLEKKYQDESLNLLKLLTSIIDDLDSFSKKDLLKEDCEGCKLNSNKLFHDLKQDIVEDPDDLFNSIQGSLSMIETKQGCIECVSDLNDDFNIILSKISRFRKKILVKGFGIVED